RKTRCLTNKRSTVVPAHFKLQTLEEARSLVLLRRLGGSLALPRCRRRRRGVRVAHAARVRFSAARRKDGVRVAFSRFEVAPRAWLCEARGFFRNADAWGRCGVGWGSGRVA